jgi:hypothetical protein
VQILKLYPDFAIGYVNRFSIHRFHEAEDSAYLVGEICRIDLSNARSPTSAAFQVILQNVNTSP